MSNARKISGFLVFFLLLGYCFRNFFTEGMIVGIYANTNYQYEPFLPEIPYQADKLILRKGNRFSSGFWGNGHYEITYSITGTTISLYNEDENAGYSGLKICRDGFGKPKIILDDVHNHCFLKIE